MVTISGFVGYYSLCRTTLLFHCREKVSVSKWVNGHSYVLIKLYLQNQMVGHIWPADSWVRLIGNVFILVTIMCLVKVAWERGLPCIFLDMKVEHGAPNDIPAILWPRGNQPQDGVQIEVGRGESWKEPGTLMELSRCIRHPDPAQPLVCHLCEKMNSSTGWAGLCYLTSKASRQTQFQSIWRNLWVSHWMNLSASGDRALNFWGCC